MRTRSLQRSDAACRNDCRTRRLDPTRQLVGCAKFLRTQSHSHHDDGMGRWLRFATTDSPHCLQLVGWHDVSSRRWKYINEVIITEGPDQSRFKAGVAVAIVRECLAALAALHREGIVHGDVKPANIMLKRSGHVKLIDMGSAIDYRNPPRDRECTPMYAAPEVLEDRVSTPRQRFGKCRLRADRNAQRSQPGWQT